MDTIKVLLVDDEPLALELLETYVGKLHGLQLIAKCANALEAFSVLSKQQVDVVFLDINMPEISGIDFIKALKNPPAIVFTTAYSEFAVESYELNALDYMLKPVTFDRFIKAVNKVSELLKNNKDAVEPVVRKTEKDDILFVKSDGKMIKIDLAQIWFVEGLKNYVRLWMDNGKVIVHTTMKHIEDQLSDKPMFVRINKSYIINLRFVTEVDGNVIRLKGEMLTVGSTYKDDVQQLLDKHKLV